MATFQPGTPIETAEPVIEVTVTPEAPLSAGRHRFQLVVVDDAGNPSDPDVVDVIVRDAERPTAVLRAPAQVDFGRSFILDGRASSDAPPGRVVRFQWTLVQ